MLGKKLIKAAAGNAGAEVDEYFNQTTLLLHGDGNQGANNFSNAGPPSYLAFSDNSSNDFPITVNGDAYGSPFSPYSLSDGNWSNYFDGNSDYLTTPVSANLGLGSSDFSIEWWENRDSTKNYAGVLGGNTSYVALYDPIIWSESGNVVVYLSSAASSWDTLNAFNLGSIDVGQWVHFCLTKNGSTFRGFKNGVLTSVTTTTNTVYMSANSWRIGYAQNRGGVDTFPGNISNLRMSIGSIPTGYQTSSTTPSTSIFTPSTSPLTTSSQGATSTDVELLICQSNRFKDNSSNAFTITPNGNVAVKTLNPFNATIDGTTGSGYFDGTGDWLTVPDNAALEVGSSDFTEEFWIYPTTSSLTGSIIDKRGNAGNYSECPQIQINANQPILYVSYTGSSWAVTINGSSNVKPYSWNHIAATRNGSTWTLWLNGTSVGTATSSGTVYSGASSMSLGAATSGGDVPITGYLSNLRIVNGTAVYTSNFTPPTTTLPNVTNTQLLTCQYQGTVRNVGFIDSSPNNFPITRNGNTTQGSFSPFSVGTGEWSGYFAGGSTSYIETDATTLFDQNAEATFQCWIYPTQFTTSTSAVRRMYVFIKGIIYAGLSIHSDGTLGWYGYPSGSIITASSSGTIVTNEWQHIAIVMSPSSNYIKLYKNGVEVGTSAYSAYGTNGAALRIGNGDTGQATDSFIGYMSNVKVSASVATLDYASPPVPSTTSGAGLLTLQANRFYDASGNRTVTPQASVSIQPFSPFAPSAAYSPSVNGGSGYFDGSDYLKGPTSSNIDFSTGDFSIELWSYPTDLGFRIILSAPNNSSTQLGYDPGNGPRYFYFYNGGNALSSGSGHYKANQFNHIVVCRSSNVLSMFINGIRVATNPSYTTAVNFSDLYIGRYDASAAYYTLGYVSNIRFVKGSTPYDPTQTTITVPTAPLTAIANTSLLLNFTNAGIYDSTAKNDLETVGNAQVDTSVVKYGTGSMKFDGASDYLKAKNSRLFDLGSGDFTLEFWAYHNNITSPAYQMYCGQFNSNGTNPGWNIYKYTNGIVQFYANSGTPTLTSSNVITAGNWYHIAVTRSGSTMRLFIDGVQEASTTNASFTDETTNSFYVGARSDTVGTYDMNGYIDDLRITKGVARYTSNFTVPDKAFPNQ